MRFRITTPQGIKVNFTTHLTSTQRLIEYTYLDSKGKKLKGNVNIPKDHSLDAKVDEIVAIIDSMEKKEEDVDVWLKKHGI